MTREHSSIRFDLVWYAKNSLQAVESAPLLSVIVSMPSPFFCTMGARRHSVASLWYHISTRSASAGLYIYIPATPLAPTIKAHNMWTGFDLQQLSKRIPPNNTHTHTQTVICWEVNRKWWSHFKSQWGDGLYLSLDSRCKKILLRL